jgi:hypothetical protein
MAALHVVWEYNGEFIMLPIYWIGNRAECCISLGFRFLISLLSIIVLGDEFSKLRSNEGLILES